MSILETRRLSKSFGGVKAVKEVDLRIDQGELSSIIGPNGAGKTTLFNLISGSLVPDSGRIVFDGNDITGRSCPDVSRMGIGRAFQRANLFPRMTVYENVAVAVQVNINFLKPAFEGDTLTAEAIRVSEGRTLGLYHITIFKSEKKIAFFSGLAFKTS